MIALRPIFKTSSAKYHVSNHTHLKETSKTNEPLTPELLGPIRVIISCRKLPHPDSFHSLLLSHPSHSLSGAPLPCFLLNISISLFLPCLRAFHSPGILTLPQDLLTFTACLPIYGTQRGKMFIVQETHIISLYHLFKNH